MQILICIFTYLSGHRAEAATVQWIFGDFTSAPQTIRRIYITPLSTPSVNGQQIQVNDRNAYTNDASGSLIVSNVLAGSYQVDFVGHFVVTTITNTFPGTNGFLNAKDWISLSTNAPGNVLAYSQTQSDALFVHKAGDTMSGGLTNGSGFFGEGYGLLDLAASNITTGTLADARLSSNIPLLNAANLWSAANTWSANSTNLANVFVAGLEMDGSLTATNGVTNLFQTMNTLTYADSRHGYDPVTLDSTLSFSPPTLSVVGANLTGLNASQLTSGTCPVARLPSLVSSVTIPMGAMFTNSVGDGASITPASAQSNTNAGDAFVFASGSFTNAVQIRLAPPWDWDGNPMEMGLRVLSFGTNNTTATNTVWAVRSAAIGQGDREDSVTYGTYVRVTNHINIAAYTSVEAITAGITAGNTPSAIKSLLFQIVRQAKDGGDTLTNTCALVEARLYYARTLRTDLPTPSP